MRASGLPIVLCLGIVSIAAHGQVYKCREAAGSILYSDAPCEADAETMGIMGKGSLRFDTEMRSDTLVAEDLRLLDEQEAALGEELEQADADSADMTEAAALRLEIQARIDSVRRQKNALLGRGLSKKDGEELVFDQKK